MQVTRIVAVRHGETAWNRDTRIQGHTDIPLNAHGQWQATQLARALQDEAFAACYASDLSRAHATAQAVAARQHLPVNIHTGLRERCFGAFEGHTWKDLETQFPSDTLAWRKRVPDYAPSGGESLLQLQARVVAAVTELAARDLFQGLQRLLLTKSHGTIPTTHPKKSSAASQGVNSPNFQTPSRHLARRKRFARSSLRSHSFRMNEKSFLQ